MTVTGSHDARQSVGTLDLHVRYIGETRPAWGGTRSCFAYAITSLDPAVARRHTGDDLYSGVSMTVSTRRMLATLASFLSDAGERYRATMEAPDDEYPDWLYEAAYLNADELSLLSAEADDPGTDHMDARRFVDIVFQHGDDATEALTILNNQGEHAALQHLTQWDNGRHTDITAHTNGHVYDEPPGGGSDRQYTHGTYVMNYNATYGYIGLVRTIEKRPIDTPPAGIDSANLRRDHARPETPQMPM